MSVGVLLAIDCTGSMEVIHKYLANSLAEIVSKFNDEGVPVQFSAIGFRDYPANPGTAFEISDFEEDVSQLERWLANVKAFGGGSNFGESSMSGVIHGIMNVNWPDVKRRVVALFTDDGPHIPDYMVESWTDARDKLSQWEIEQFHLFTINRKVERYDELDGHDYVVIRHNLADDNLEDLELETLEQSVRDFVKVSSSGNFGSSEIISREEDFESNPFDIDDYETESKSVEEVKDFEVEELDDDFFEMD
tara:strand:+ start:2038 stop:2784 length:747 start_codon:yes stop_codon:yes gene_type:complete